MNRTYKISLSPEFYSDTVHVSQYDSDYNIIFNVFDKYSAASSIDGMTAHFTGTRSDGLGFTFDATASGSSVSFEINTSMTAIAGTNTAEIVFYDENDLYFGSANVQIVVEPAARPNGTIDADTERAEEIAEEIQQIVDTAAATVEASLGTLSNLTTTDKSSVVAAINEVDANTDTNTTAIGTLSNLTTEAKTNLVSAINEVDAHADTNAQAITQLNTDLTDDISDLNSQIANIENDFDYAPGKNLIDFSKITTGYELSNNVGAISPASGWYVTDWIEVEPNTTYTKSGLSSNFRAEVGADKTSYTGIAGALATFVTGPNTKYVRFNSQVSGYSQPQLEKGGSASAYTPYEYRSKWKEETDDDLSELQTAVENVDNTVIELEGEMPGKLEKNKIASANLFDGTYWSIDGFLRNTGFVESEGFKTTNAILLQAGNYLVNYKNSSFGDSAKSRYASCDSDGTNITILTATDTGETITIGSYEYNILSFTVSADGYYRFNAGSSSDNAQYFMIIKGDTFPDSFVPYFEPYYEVESGVRLNDAMRAEISANSPLYGKKLSVNGDSICAGLGAEGGYATIIGNLYDMTVQNIAVSGGSIAYASGRYCISRNMTSMAQDADYAIIEGGVNDASLGLTLGSISDGYDATLDDTTFYGAFESMLKQLITRFAGKKYGYIIVHQMTTNYRVVNDPATSYYWAAKKCCEKWGVPYLDLNIEVPPFGMFNHSPTWELRTAYTLNNDGWHPNLEGYKKYYVPKIAAWMEML